ncbi:hypothetical protein E4U32_004241 [Claviceps aff. humidiphila group G2b]|nr:hypothetical protein E4U32_004241 [Claviceps aff. humidiphila group G2b]
MGCAGTKQDLAALPGNQIHEAALVGAFTLALDQEAVQARLKCALDVWKRIQVEVKEAFSVASSDTISESVRKQESHDALAESGMRLPARGAEAQESKGRQLISCILVNFCSSLYQRGSWAIVDEYKDAEQSCRWMFPLPWDLPSHVLVAERVDRCLWE